MMGYAMSNTAMIYVSSFFQIDVSYYPYDHQKCGIEVTSWGFTTSQVMLDHMFDGINLEDYRSHITLIFHAISYV